MTANTPARAVAPTFQEVVLRGSPKIIRGLLAGLAMGRGQCLTVWFHDEDGIAPSEGVIQRAAELLHLRATDVRLVAGGEIVKLVREHEREARSRGLCEVVSVTTIKSAAFAVTYAVAAPRYDREIQELLHDLPRGLSLEDEQHAVRTDPKAMGVEVYTPAHDYEARGHARLTGRFDLVMAKRKQLLEHPLIKAEVITLELAAQ